MKPPAKPPVPAAPTITRIEPGGVQTGTTTKIRITGKDLAGIKEVKFSTPGLSATIESIDPKGTSADISVAAGDKLQRGPIEFNVVSPSGASLNAKLLVDSLPQIVAAALRAADRALHHARQYLGHACENGAT